MNTNRPYRKSKTVITARARQPRWLHEIPIAPRNSETDWRGRCKSAKGFILLRSAKRANYDSRYAAATGDSLFRSSKHDFANVPWKLGPWDAPVSDGAPDGKSANHAGNQIQSEKHSERFEEKETTIFCLFGKVYYSANRYHVIFNISWEPIFIHSLICYFI